MDTFTTKPGSVTGPYPESFEIEAAGPVATTGVFIDAGGELAGTSTDATGTHGFTGAALGDTTPFVAAAGQRSITVAGIDTAGDVFGSYTDSSGSQHGYVYRNGAATTVDPAGSYYTVSG